MDNETKNKKKFSLSNAKKTGKKILVLVIVAIIVFGVGVYIGVSKPWQDSEPVITSTDDSVIGDNYTLTISTVEKIVAPASDLITSKYNYKDADTYEDYKQLFDKKIPLTTDKVVFTYKGTVSVGVDLSEVEYDIDNENGTISIKLPEIKIKSNEIDASSFEYPFESNSIFNVTGMSDYTELLAMLKEKKEEEVKNDTEFMDEAKLNTQNVLKDFLTISDATKDYTVTFK